MMPIVDFENDEAAKLRLQAWFDSFVFYRIPPTREKIKDWIGQFAAEEQELGAKILDNIFPLSDQNIHQSYANAIHEIGGWSKDENERSGRWFFVGLGGPGESGASMLHLIRETLDIENDCYQSMFISALDLAKLQLTAMDVVIFVDDFSGTGDQFFKRWDVLKELIASEARTYLLLAAVTSAALARLKTLQDISVFSDYVLPANANVFDEENAIFNQAEKAAILKYCKRANKGAPKGWGKCGLLLVISRKTPNNSLPILHAKSNRWLPIFPRKVVVVGLPPAAEEAA